MRAAARGGARSFYVDAVKALAAQAIVWHHLAFYGPMADRAAALWPQAIEALSRHGRLAVAAFLVLGGYLAARSLAPDGRLLGTRPLALRLLDRFGRLVLPYAVVVFAAVLANAVASRWMDHDSISPWLGWGQVLAHLLLLQDVLGVPALSAGVWYVTIDFQLYAVLLALLGLSTRFAAPAGRTAASVLAVAAVAGLASASLLGFNRWPVLDVTALYFFGLYAMGVWVAWAPGATRLDGRIRPVWLPMLWWAAALGVVALALALAWRDRVAVGAAVALGLALSLRMPAPEGGTGRALRAVAAWLADRSYALFLVHFPVCLLVNAAFDRWASHGAGVQALGMAVAASASLAVAMAFHAGVERPIGRWLGAPARTPGQSARLGGAGGQAS